MKIAVTLVIVLMALFLLRLMLTPARSRSATGRAASARSAVEQKNTFANTAGGAFRGVSLKRGPQACEQAKALGNRRFLPGQLGQLPLQGCTSANCTCKFVHHEDRRSDRGDQRAPSALRSELYHASGKQDRRKRAGRRKSDLA